MLRSLKVWQLLASDEQRKAQPAVKANSNSNVF